MSHRRGHRIGWLAWIIIILALVGVAGISVYANNGFKHTNYVPISVGQNFVESENNLGVNFIKYQFAHGSTGNVAIAPSGLAAPLALIYTTTAGNAHSAIGHLLGFSGMSNHAVNISNQTILNSLISPAGSTVRLNNNWWLDSSLKAQTSYLKAANTYYHMPLTNVAFGSSTAASTISSTLKQNFGSDPVGLGGVINNQTTSLITNSSYFADNWEYGFNPAQTNNAQFTTLTGQTLNWPLMRQTNVFNYYAANGIKVVQLPFGADGSLVMNIYLPNDFTSFMQNLSTTSLSNLNDKLGQYQVILALPRFNVDYQANLKATLQGMGLGDLFTSVLAQGQVVPGLRLSDFLTFNNLSINSQGVVGSSQAAATNTADMNIDRPFMFTIVDSASGNFVMIGFVTNPGQP